MLEATVRPFAPSTVAVARGELPWWGRLARLKLEISYDHEWMARATLADGGVGADVLTTSRSRLAAVEALERLVEVVLADVADRAICVDRRGIGTRSPRPQRCPVVVDGPVAFACVGGSHGHPRRNVRPWPRS